MKKVFWGLTLFTLGMGLILLWGRGNEAQAITNLIYQNDQEKYKQNQDEIMQTQKEIKALLLTLQDTVNKMGGDLKELKAANAENKAAMQKVQDASRDSVNSQGQSLGKLQASINENQQKNLKILEMIYQILQKIAPQEK